MKYWEYNDPMRIVFMGTPPFAATVLQALLDSGQKLVGVITQPDRPRGRRRQMESTAVCILAGKRGLPILKPVNSKDPAFLETLQIWKPDLTVVAAFGLILSKAVLAVAPRGNINVHASLLPKFRGAAPVQDAIIKGESITGVTTMLMDTGLDTGDILLRREVAIDPDTTAGELEEALSIVGSELLMETLRQLEAGLVVPVPQDNALATYSPSMKPDAGYILWNENACNTHNRIRGCTPRPGARCFYRGQPVRIWRALRHDDEVIKSCKPGQIVKAEQDAILTACSEGVCLALREVQPAGKSRMSGGDFARGAHLRPGAAFDVSAPEE